MEANAEKQRPSVPLTHLIKQRISDHLKRQNHLIKNKEPEHWTKSAGMKAFLANLEKQKS